jgi:hypothetical protein
MSASVSIDIKGRSIDWEELEADEAAFEGVLPRGNDVLSIVVVVEGMDTDRLSP